MKLCSDGLRSLKPYGCLLVLREVLSIISNTLMRRERINIHTVRIPCAAVFDLRGHHERWVFCLHPEPLTDPLPLPDSPSPHLPACLHKVHIITTVLMRILSFCLCVCLSTSPPSSRACLTTHLPLLMITDVCTRYPHWWSWWMVVVVVFTGVTFTTLLRCVLQCHHIII